MRTHTSRGFTLIELMVVIAIIAIIAAIAIPSYTEQVRKGRRADAARAVGQLQLDLERWRAENPCYGQPSVGTCPAYTASGTYPTTPTSDYYTIAVSSQSATNYSVTATPAGVQASDRCGVLTATRSSKPTWATPACN